MQSERIRHGAKEEEEKHTSAVGCGHAHLKIREPGQLDRGGGRAGCSKHTGQGMPGVNQWRKSAMVAHLSTASVRLAGPQLRTSAHRVGTGVHSPAWGPLHFSCRVAALVICMTRHQTKGAMDQPSLGGRPHTARQ